MLLHKICIFDNNDFVDYSTWKYFTALVECCKHWHLQGIFWNKGFGCGTRQSTNMTIMWLENIITHLSIAENFETYKESFETKVLITGHGNRQTWQLCDLKIFYLTCRLLKNIETCKESLKQRFWLQYTAIDKHDDYATWKYFISLVDCWKHWNFQRTFWNKGFGCGMRLSTILALMLIENFLSYLSFSENFDICKKCIKQRL